MTYKIEINVTIDSKHSYMDIHSDFDTMLTIEALERMIVLLKERMVNSDYSTMPPSWLILSFLLAPFLRVWGSILFIVKRADIKLTSTLL